MPAIFDNAISKYAKLHSISLYEISRFLGTDIVLKNENDYIALLKKYRVDTIFYSYTEIVDSDEDDTEIDYEEIQYQLEKDYKFLPVFSDMLSSDEYITKLDGIIEKHLNVVEVPTYKETIIEYSFFLNSVGYSYRYIQTEGSKGDGSSSWGRASKLCHDCEADILNWGKEFARSVYTEKEELTNELRKDKEFIKCKTKDSRTMYLEKIVNLRYPHLKAIMTHPNSFKKIPDFYFSFDKSRRSFYAAEIYASIINSSQ